MAKKALIAVSGGIAVYKVCQVVSDLGKRGVDVQVIMTENATKFVTPLTFEALSKNMVFTDTFDYSYDASIKHITLAPGGRRHVCGACDGEHHREACQRHRRRYGVLHVFGDDVPGYCMPGDEHAYV